MTTRSGSRAGSGNRHGISALSRVPPPGGLSIRSVPLDRRDPVGQAAQPGSRALAARRPAPSSLTSTTIWPASCQIATSAVAAGACLATLASASDTTK